MGEYGSGAAGGGPPPDCAGRPDAVPMPAVTERSCA